MLVKWCATLAQEWHPGTQCTISCALVHARLCTISSLDNELINPYVTFSNRFQQLTEKNSRSWKGYMLSIFTKFNKPCQCLLWDCVRAVSKSVLCYKHQMLRWGAGMRRDDWQDICQDSLHLMQNAQRFSAEEDMNAVSLSDEWRIFFRSDEFASAGWWRRGG